MPKEENPITGKFRICSKRNKRVRQYSYRLKWQYKLLEYDKFLRRYRKKIDLAKTLSIRIKTNTDSKLNYQRYIELKEGTSTLEYTDIYRLYIYENEFANFYYWLLVSIIENSKYKLTQEDLTGIAKSTTKGKLHARYKLKKFDSAHEIFVNAQQAWEHDNESGVLEQDKVLSLSKRRGTVNVLGSQSVVYTGDKGTQVTKVIRSITTGRGGVVLYLAEQLGKELRILKSERRTFTKPCVLKVTSIETDNRDYNPGANMIIDEARNMIAIGKHPNIMKLLDVLVDENRLTLFFEKGDKNLRERAEESPKLTPRAIVKYAKDLLCGFCHMHSRRIFHMDIKPENALIFLDEIPNKNTVKIIDFDSSRSKLLFPGRKIYEALKWQEIGTVGYIPPESWSIKALNRFKLNLGPWQQRATDPRIPFNGVHLEKRDSFALGMTILDSLIGPKYGLECDVPHEPDKETPKRSVHRVRFWESYLTRSTYKTKIENDRLWPLAGKCLQMIDPDLDNRKTIMRAFSELFPTDFRKHYPMWQFKERS